MSSTSALEVARGYFSVIAAADRQAVSIQAYTDGMTIARQLGVMPPAGSAAEKAMTAAFNAKTALMARVKKS